MSFTERRQNKNLPYREGKGGNRSETEREGNTLFLMVILLTVTEVVVIYKVAKGLRGNGNHVGQDHSAVTAGCKQQLVMGVVIPYAPHPKTATTIIMITTITKKTSNTAYRSPDLQKS